MDNFKITARWGWGVIVKIELNVQYRAVLCKKCFVEASVMMAATKKINNLIIYENPVRYVNSVVLAVFHIFLLSLYYHGEVYQLYSGDRYILTWGGGGGWGGNCVALCKALCLCRYIEHFFMVYFTSISIFEKCVS